MEGIVIYPTDTAYAIGCDARNDEAVKRIFKIKERDASKTFPLIASGVEMVKEWCMMEEKAFELAGKFWPGPLTLILLVRRQGLSSAVISEGAVAIRVPANETARDLSRQNHAPIVSTSANASGGLNSYSIEEARASLGENVNLVDTIIDVGPLPPRPVSTIVKIKDNKVEVVRQGEIKI